MAQMVTDGCPQADGEVKSNNCYWQKFNYGWHKLRGLLCNLKNIFYLCSPNGLIKVAHRWH